MGDSFRHGAHGGYKYNILRVYRFHGVLCVQKPETQKAQFAVCVYGGGTCARGDLGGKRLAHRDVPDGTAAHFPIFYDGLRKTSAQVAFHCAGRGFCLLPCFDIHHGADVLHNLRGNVSFHAAEAVCCAYAGAACRLSRKLLHDASCSAVLHDEQLQGRVCRSYRRLHPAACRVDSSCRRSYCVGCVYFHCAEENSR